MARATSLVLGELVRRSTVDNGGAVVVRLQAVDVNRNRAEPSYTLAVQLQGLEAAGFIVLDDKNGYAEKMKFAAIGLWLAKHLGAGNNSLTIEMQNASIVGVGFDPARLAKRLSDFAAIDIVGLNQTAADKLASVANWLPSVRKSAVVNAAAAMTKNIAVIDYLNNAGPLPEPEPQNQSTG